MAATGLSLTFAGCGDRCGLTVTQYLRERLSLWPQGCTGISLGTGGGWARRWEGRRGCWATRRDPRRQPRPSSSAPGNRRPAAAAAAAASALRRGPAPAAQPTEFGPFRLLAWALNWALNRFSCQVVQGTWPRACQPSETGLFYSQESRSRGEGEHFLLSSD